MAAPNPNNVYVQVRPLYATLQPFDAASTSVASWLQRFEAFCFANSVEEEPAATAGVVPHNQRRAIFLANLGDRAYEALRQLCLPEEPNTRTIPEFSGILKEKFEPEGLVSANSYAFNKRIQHDNESASDFIASIQSLAQKCNFGNHLDRALRDSLVADIKSGELRRKLYRIYYYYYYAHTAFNIRSSKECTPTRRSGTDSSTGTRSSITR